VRANTITYTIDGNLGEWSTSYPGYVEWADPANDTIGVGPYSEHTHLDIIRARQSIGFIAGQNPSNWYVLWGLETAAPFTTDGFEKIRQQLFVNDPRVGGGPVSDYPSLSGQADFFAEGFLTDVDPDTAQVVMKTDGTRYGFSMKRWSGSTWVSFTPTFAKYAYHNTATNGYLEIGVLFSDLGFSRFPPNPDPFGWALADDDYDTVEPNRDLSPNPGTGSFGATGPKPNNDGNWNYGFTPEPGTTALFLVGLLGLGAIRRKRA